MELSRIFPAPARKASDQLEAIRRPSDAIEREVPRDEIERFFSAIWAEPRRLGDPTPHRLPVAWRLLRELARQRGVLEEPHDPLEKADEQHAFDRAFRAFVEPKDMVILRLVEQCDTTLCLPALPESIPSAEERQNWCLQMARCARLLRVQRTTEGREGLAGLCVPEMVDDLMPALDRILEFEAMVVRHTCKTMSERGTAAAQDWLEETYDLMPREVKDVLAMARARAVELAGLDDPTQVAAVQILRIEHDAQKLEEAHDFRAAAMVRRDLARLAKSVVSDAKLREDDLEEDLRVVKTTVRSSQSQRLVPKRVDE